MIVKKNGTANISGICWSEPPHDVRGDFQPATWRAFWETAVEGRSRQEVAAELGMSIASVYMAKHRITGRLRQHVQYLRRRDVVKSAAACPDNQHRLSAMLDETLSFEEQHAVQQHVDGCQACQLRLDAMVVGDAMRNCRCVT